MTAFSANLEILLATGVKRKMIWKLQLIKKKKTANSSEPTIFYILVSPDLLVIEAQTRWSPGQPISLFSTAVKKLGQESILTAVGQVTSP